MAGKFCYFQQALSQPDRDDCYAIGVKKIFYSYRSYQAGTAKVFHAYSTVIMLHTSGVEFKGAGACIPFCQHLVPNNIILRAVHPQL